LQALTCRRPVHRLLALRGGLGLLGDDLQLQGNHRELGRLRGGWAVAELLDLRL